LADVAGTRIDIFIENLFTAKTAKSAKIFKGFLCDLRVLGG
jgi:hypothetical protein